MGGRGYSSYPGLLAGYPTGVLGPAILPSDSRIPLTMGEYVNLSLLGHT